VATVVVKDLRKVFNGGGRTVIALDRISFEVADQTFVSIVGPSGCGKSTLLNILSGVEVPTAGTAEIRNGTNKARVGYVFQAARLLPWRTVMDNMLFVQSSRTAETRERIVHYLDMVGLADVQKAYPAQLSGGMQQRVGIARAFSIEPSALLMDEPFSHLDAINARQLRKELQSIWSTTKKTVLFVTHDVAEAVELSNRVLILEKGGTLREDLKIDLPFPRDQSDPDVALLRAEVLRRFDDDHIVE
jgi:NitT/TauT family transport system ATP-binding protein